MSNGTGPIVLDPDQATAVRRALMDGLLCYGEYDRLHNAAEVLKESATPIPAFALARHPTGDAETVTKFANALYYVDSGTGCIEPPDQPAKRLADEPEHERPTPANRDDLVTKAIIQMVEDREDNLLSLIRCLEHRLAQSCNVGGDAPDDAPLTEWHLARVLLDLLDSRQHVNAVASYLGVTGREH